MIATIPSFAREYATVPPTLLSLMPPVSGLFAPTERRPVFTKVVPVKYPGAKISLFSLPRGSVVAGTSLFTIIEVSARPPSIEYSSGTSSHSTV